VFYVVEGGELRIYDTTTDKIYTTTSIDIFGHAVDVKLVDFLRRVGWVRREKG